MNKPLIFTFGIICGIFIYGVTTSITDAIKTNLLKYTINPVTTKQVQSPKDQAPGQNSPDNETSQPSTKSNKNYVKYWQSGGFKFKDVGANGVEKTFIWNESSKEWVDSGCIGNFSEEN